MGEGEWRSVSMGEREGEDGEGFYIAQSGRRADLHVSKGYPIESRV